MCSTIPELRSVQNMFESTPRLFVILGLVVTLYCVRRSLKKVEVAQAAAVLESGYIKRTIVDSVGVSRSVVVRL